MTIPFIDLRSQYVALEVDVKARINAVLEHGQYIMGPEVVELEAALAAYVESEYCITEGSGTDALLISLMALGIGRGDEVITTPFSFAATAEVIALLGASPVFVDVEADTCNINADLIEEKITDRTAAIMPVSLYGQAADMDEINAIAIRHGIPVIEDAAQSFGATYKRRFSCNLSTVGCTSFFPSKPLGCYGDGGAIFTNDAKIAEACQQIRVHGQSERYVHSMVGLGGRMDTMQCAVVLAKLGSFSAEVARRHRVAERYEYLLDEPKSRATPHGLSTVACRSDRTSVYAQYTVLVENRAYLREQLQARGVPTAVHYPKPLNEQPAYANFCCPDCTPVAKDLSNRVMSLPMSPYLSEADQDVVVAELLNVLDEFS